MITKPKIIVLAIFLAVVGLLAWLLVDDHLRWYRREARRITIRYGFLVAGIDSGYTPAGYFKPYRSMLMDFNIAMGSEIAARLGMRVAFITSSQDGIFSGLDEDRYDIIIPSVPITPERQAAHTFTSPYLANPLVMVTLKNSPLRSPAEVAGEALSYIPRRHDQVYSSFAELELGRIDAVITDIFAASYFIARADSPFEIAWKSPDPDLFGIFLKKGNDRLAEAINRALEDMFYDGTMLRISMATFGIDIVTQARYNW